MNIKLSQKGTEFRYRGKDYITSLIGEHQAYNASLIIESIKKYDSSIDEKVIQKGLKSVFWPGRIQKIHKNIFFDVAHNKTSIRSLISTMKLLFPNLPLYGLFFLKGDKEIELIAKEMSEVFEQLFVCDDKNKLLLKKEILSKKLINHSVENKITTSIQTGIDKLKYLVTKKGVGIVFGSHYIAKDILRCSEISFIR
jgi:folylpolyglutamate synthase/dihydropteroate synthase